jgi:restriction system protein
VYYKRRKQQQALTPGVVLLVLTGVAVALASSPALVVRFELLLAVLLVAGMLAGGVVIGVLWYRDRQRRTRLRALAVSDVDRMSGTGFEEYLAQVLTSQGWRVTRTGKTGDFGNDLLLVREGERVVAQLKRYARPVGIEAVQQAVAACAFYQARKSMVVTNNTFTPAARRLAEVNRCELIDRETLAEWVHRFQAGPV